MATVARGRFEPEYGHTIQLCALIKAGFIERSDALWDVEPVGIAAETEKLLYEATPEAFARGAKLLVQAIREPGYFMYERKRLSFLSLAVIRAVAQTLS